MNGCVGPILEESSVDSVTIPNHRRENTLTHNLNVSILVDFQNEDQDSRIPCHFPKMTAVELQRSSLNLSINGVTVYYSAAEWIRHLSASRPVDG